MRLAERVETVLPALPVGVAAMFALRRLGDFDTWWHLASGRWIFLQRTVPHTDTLSFTVPGHAWTNLQWLFDLAVYALHQVGGPSLLVLASTVAFGLMTWFLVKNIRLFLGPVATSGLALWVTLTAQERFQIRPEMISLPFLEIFLWLLAAARRDSGRRIWLLVPLMLIWVNTHALFVIGVFTMGCAVVSSVASSVRVLPAGWRGSGAVAGPGARRLYAGVAAAAAVTLLNPYLFEGVRFPFELLSRIGGADPAFRTIGEFRPPFSGYFPSQALVAYTVFLFLSAAIVVAAGVVSALPGHGSGKRGEVRFDVGGLVLFVGLAWLSLLARRNAALFMLGAAPFVARCARILGEKLPGGVRGRGAAAASVTAMGLLCVAPVLGWDVASNGFYRRDGETREFGIGVLGVNFPIRASAFVRAARLPRHLYNDMTAGGYLTWDDPLGEGVFVDGRLEVYGSRFFAAYGEALRAPRLWQREADRFGINTALIFHRWGNRRRLVGWLHRSRDWALVYYDEVAVVFVRRAGNEAAVTRAARLFPRWQEKTAGVLSPRPRSWQFPFGYATGLFSYASLLEVLGRTRHVVELYDRLLELGIGPRRRAAVRMRIAAQYAREGRMIEARRQVERALEADPANRQAARLLRRLGR